MRYVLHIDGFRFRPFQTLYDVGSDLQMQELNIQNDGNYASDGEDPYEARRMALKKV